MAKPKKDKYLNKATSQKAAELIREGNYRTAARLIGHRIDPTAPMAAGSKAMSKKAKLQAARQYRTARAKAATAGRTASKEIAVARKAARELRYIDSALGPSSLRTPAKQARQAIITRSLKEANLSMGLGKAVRNRARAASVFGIAAMFAQHLMEGNKKKRG